MFRVQKKKRFRVVEYTKKNEKGSLGVENTVYTALHGVAPKLGKVPGIPVTKDVTRKVPYSSADSSFCPFCEELQNGYRVSFPCLFRF